MPQVFTLLTTVFTSTLTSAQPSHFSKYPAVGAWKRQQIYTFFLLLVGNGGCCNLYYLFLYLNGISNCVGVEDTYRMYVITPILLQRDRKSYLYVASEQLCTSHNTSHSSRCSSKTGISNFFFFFLNQHMFRIVSLEQIDVLFCFFYTHHMSASRPKGS